MINFTMVDPPIVDSAIRVSGMPPTAESPFIVFGESRGAQTDVRSPTHVDRSPSNETWGAQRRLWPHRCQCGPPYS